ncbi:MAG: chromosome segregation protein SMC [Candidatus Omnitrophica bacterium]|nr:chromosome segregation protein SMC [Candidatus Omnitrophota bacterium]MDD5670643.1 chromosome segregation protein SMC [Candidatus Omnitrophota bacterium]
MRLKKLELFGFKSFANRTEIFFDQGVTCVVGPNGCGKSNISDSIRWVLGERSAKLLRGSKMEDVIFNGTEFRKPLAVAEVSLTIDNEDRKLPIDYNEVTLTRRLYRSGESEYLINRTQVRLKDIQDLILDTGIGSSSYSMIEQGRIDYILNADATERRFLIEEAAGISKFKVKKEEALRKLERTEQNLLRLNDIVQEVHRNIQYAERQARRAERYKEQFERLKQLETAKSFHDLKNLSEGKSVLDEKRAQADAELKAIEAEKNQCRELLMTQERTLRELQERFSAEESKRFGLQSTLEKNEQQLKFHQEKRVALATRQGEIQQEQSHLAERLQRYEKDIAAKREELIQLEQNQGRLQEQFDTAKARLQAAENDVEQKKARLEMSKMEAFEIAGEITKLRNEYHRVLAFLESCERQKTKLEENLRRFTNEYQRWETKKVDYEKELFDLNERVAELEKDKDRLGASMTEIKARLEEAGREKQKLADLIREKTVRVEMLRKLDAASGVDKETLVREMPELENGLIRSIREVVKVQAGYERAFEAVFGLFAQSWVAEDLDAAQKLFNYLSEKKSNSLGLLIKSASGAMLAADPEVVLEHGLIRCALRDVVEITPGYELMLDPILNGAFVIDKFETENLEELIVLAENAIFVTDDGVCVGPRGYVSFRRTATSEQSFFQRGKEIEDLEKEIGDLGRAVEQYDLKQSECAQQLKEAGDSLQSVHADLLDCQLRKESSESFRNGVADRLVSNNQELEIVSQDMAEVEVQQSEVAGRKAKLEFELAGMEARETAHRGSEEQLRLEIEQSDDVRSDILKIYADCNAKFDHMQEQVRLLRESVDILLESDAEDRKRIRNLTDESVRIVEKNRELDLEDERLNLEQKQIETDVRQADVAIEMMSQEKKCGEDEIAGTQQKIQGFSEKLNGLQDVLHQSEMKSMDLGYQEKAIQERLAQTYHINLAELNAGDYPWNEQEAEEANAEIAKLRERVEQMGAVNLLAIEEYDELKKRYDFLNAQQKDMESAREELMEAIRKINRTTKTLFEETFANVQAKFREYYQILFHGGEAKLILIDEEHPLESGIDIVVRPPGKKQQHVTLLSGGEKALTAIALLFALFCIRPSPFCVLDEVDAPLDEANIDRFLTVLRTFLELTQFIIVTHNRKTIAMGDSLYGVTMEEAGVSKIVSVKVHEDQATAAADGDDLEATKEEDTTEDAKEDTVQDSVSA